MNKTYIIENSPVSVLLGLFIQHIGLDDVPNFQKNISIYKELPNQLKNNSDVLNTLHKDIDNILNCFNGNDEKFILEQVFLINKQTKKNK